MDCSPILHTNQTTMNLVRIFLFLSCFSGSLYIHAQIDYRTQYHPNINQAELAILNENYDLALRYYQMAFRSVPTGFARDFHNASLCAIELKAYTVAIGYMRKLATKGVKKSFFTDHMAWYRPLKGNGLTPFLKEYDTLRKQTFTNKTYNKELVDQLEALSEQEKGFRDDRTTIKDLHPQIDQDQIHNFLNLVDLYGFPTEEMLGIDSPMESVNDKKDRYHKIIWNHIRKWKEYDNIVDVQPVLLLAVRQGKLEPEVAATYFDLALAKVEGVGPYASTDVIQFGQDPSLYILTNHEVTTNQFRAELGLCATEEKEQKLYYHFIQNPKKTKFKLMASAQVSNYPKELKHQLPLRPL